MKYLVLFTISLSILLGACKVTDRVLYQRALKNAMYTAGEPANDSLVAIPTTPGKGFLKDTTINDTTYFLAVAWKKQKYSYAPGPYNTKSYETWVTMAPELLHRMKHRKGKDVNKSLQQLLGLPPEPAYTSEAVFVEFWVQSKSMFRPCPDKEITDTKCDRCITVQDTSDAAHVKWMNNNRIGSYFNCEVYSNYPWTQLGYTYDWSPRTKNHIGLSEFVIQKNSKVYVRKLYTTSDYLKKEAAH